jgi:hypothetical protein
MNIKKQNFSLETQQLFILWNEIWKRSIASIFLAQNTKAIYQGIL